MIEMARSGFDIGKAFVQIAASFDGTQKQVSDFFSKMKPVNIPATIDPDKFSSEAKKAVDRVVMTLNGSGLKPVEVEVKTRTDQVGAEVKKAAERAAKATQVDLGQVKVDTTTASRTVANVGKNVTVTLPTTIDDALAQARLRELASQRLSLKAKVDADLTELHVHLNELRRSRPKVVVDIDLEKTRVEADIHALEARKTHLTLQVDADTKSVLEQIEDIRANHTAIQARVDADISRARAKLDALANNPPKVGVDVALETTRLKTQIEALEARKALMRLQVEADVTGATAKIDELTARNVALLARVDADISAARSKLAELEAQKPRLQGQLDLDIAKAEAQIAALEAKRSRVQIQVDADTAAAEAGLSTVQGQVSRLGSTQADINVESSSASRAIGLMALLTAGISAVGYAAPAAAAAVAAIPAALFAVGQGVGTLLAAFSGIGNAVKAMQAADDDTTSKASSNARTRASAANSIASAQSALANAQAAADRASITGAQQVEQARKGLARSEEALATAREQGLRRVQDAERSLAAAQRAALAAQKALNDARQEAKERIEDLQLSLKGTALDEESAMLALEKAVAKVAALASAGVTDGLEFREADLSARQAAQSLAEVRERYADLKTEAAHAARTGVEGDQAVVAARERVGETTQKVQDAERSLSEVRTDSARQVARAQAQVAESADGVGRAQQQAAWATESAARAVADAQRNLGAASHRAGEDGTAAMDKLRLALSKLTPEGRAFATFLQREAKPALQDLGDAAQRSLLPRLTVAFRELLKLQPEVKSAITETGNALGEMAVKGARLVTSGPWRKDFVTISRNNVSVMRNVGDAGLSIADALRSVVVISGPTLRLFSELAAHAAKSFDEFVQGKRETGELGEFFKTMSERLQELFRWIYSVGKGIYDLVTTLSPLGAILLDIVKWVAELVSDFTAWSPLLANIIGGAGLLAAGFIFLGRSITGVIGAFRSGYKGFGQLQDQMSRVGNAMQRTADGTGRLSGVVDTALHPVSRLRDGITSLTAAYRDGSTAAKAWAGSHLDSKSAPSPGGDVGGQLRDVDASRDRLRGLAATAQDVSTRVASAMSGVVGSAQDMSTRVSGAVSRVVTSVTDMASRVPTSVSQIVTSAKSAADSLGTSLGVAAVGAAQKVDSLTASAVRGGNAVGVNLVNGLNALRTPTELAAVGMAKVVQGAETAAGSLRTGFASAVDNTVRAARTLADTARAEVSGALRHLGTVASNVSTSVQNGIGTMVAGAKQGLTGFAGAVGGAANTLRTGLTKAVTGLADVFGGPWGIAVTGAALGLAFFTAKSQEAAQSAELQRKRVSDLASSLRDSNGALDESVRKKGAEALADFELSDGKRNLLEDARKLGIALPQLTDAYLGNAGAQKSVVDQLRAIQKEHTLTADTGHGVKTTEDDIAFSARQLADIIDSQGGTFQEAVQNNKNQAAATAETTVKTKELTEQERAAKTATEDLNASLAAIADTNKTVAERGKEVIDFLDQLKGKVPSVEEAAQGINESIRNLAEGFKDSEGNAINFAKGFIDASGAIDTTTKAGSDLRGVVSGLAGDMAAAGTAAFDQARATGKSMPEAYAAAKDAMDGYLKRIRESLEANGIQGKQLDALLAQYNLIPAELATVIKLSGDKLASEQVTKVLGDLKTLPPNTPVAVTALTGPAQEALLQLGYKIFELPDGTFKIFGNTAAGQQAADAFVAANQGRPITMDIAVRNAAAQKALDDFKNVNKNFELKPFIGGAGTIHYNTPDGKVAILGTNLKYQALGGILEFFGKGGFSPLSASAATIVPPNTLRVIGDRPSGDEAFVPINREPKSISILAETARRMGYELVPLALGGILAMAGGGVTTPAAAPAPVTAAPAAVATTPDQLSALATAMATITDASTVLTAALAVLQDATINYTTTALQPLVANIVTSVMPTLQSLIATMTPVQGSFTTTAGVVTTSTQSMVGSTATAVTQIGSYLTTLRTGLQQTGQSVENTSIWMRDSWARVREYVALPSRAALVIMNDSLILGWNRLNADFGLNKPIAPIPIKFARGGKVPGIGDQDSVDAKLTPGEYVFSTEAIDAMGGLPSVDNLHRMAVAGIIGPDTRLGETGDSRRRQSLMTSVSLDDLPLHYAYGGVQPHVAVAGDEVTRVFGALPGGIGGVGSRPNVSDHPLGLALDFMTMSNQGLGDKIAGYLISNAQRLLLKYTIWKQAINEGAGWSGMEDRGSVTANHLDHVHASFLRAGQAGKAFSGGGMFDTTAAVDEAFAKTYTLIDQFAGKFPGSVMAEQAVGVVRQATDRVKAFALDKLSASSITGSPGRTANIEFARSALARFGWGADQLAPLIKLWDGESNWDHTKRNKTSGAFGIPQSLPPEKMASQGPDWRTNPATQILWGLGYIKQRPDYGSPGAAYSKWLSRSPHWYDDGGWLPPGYTTVANHTGQPEAILTRDQWNSLSSMAGVNTGGGRTITVNARTDASPEHIAHVVDRRLAIGTRL